MKIKNAGKVTIDAEDFSIAGFDFEGRKVYEDLELNKQFYEDATLVVLEWIEERIAQARLEISGKTVGFLKDSKKLEFPE